MAFSLFYVAHLRWLTNQKFKLFFEILTWIEVIQGIMGDLRMKVQVWVIVNVHNKDDEAREK